MEEKIVGTCPHLFHSLIYRISLICLHSLCACARPTTPLWFTDTSTNTTRSRRFWSLSNPSLFVVFFFSSFFSREQAPPTTIRVSTQQSTRMDALTPDDLKCIEILHRHGVDSHKLENMIDQSVNQARVKVRASVVLVLQLYYC
jgi:hypothetical protein